MSEEVTGDFSLYGYSIGVLMLDARFPRIPGDIGNATTFRYPVLHRVVRDASPHRVVVEADKALLEPFEQAAVELEKAGVRAITTNCGFLTLFQTELASAVKVPVLTSSLLLVPMVHRLLGPNRRVGILTISSSSLGERHFLGAGWSPADIPVAVQGMDNRYFAEVILGNLARMDVAKMEADIRAAAAELVAAQPDVGAIVLECTNMVPYAHAVQQVTGLPIFDITSLIDLTFASLHRRSFTGYMR